MGAFTMSVNRCRILFKQTKFLFSNDVKYGYQNLTVRSLSSHSIKPQISEAEKKGYYIPGDKLGLVDDSREEEIDNVERWELIQKVKGLESPFEMCTNTVPAGTKDNPTLVPTIYDHRTMGCICKNDSLVIKWMKLHLGETQQCDCGHWFQLVPLDE